MCNLILRETRTRTRAEVDSMSLSDQRNTMIVELDKRLDIPGSEFIKMTNTELARRAMPWRDECFAIA